MMEYRTKNSLRVVTQRYCGARNALKFAFILVVLLVLVSVNCNDNENISISDISYQGFFTTVGRRKMIGINISKSYAAVPLGY